MDALNTNERDDLTQWRARLEDRVLAPLRSTGGRYYAWIAFLLVVLGWALFAYSRQLQYGLIVTDLRDRISWGVYIASFVFFIGISHAGTLLSAILRVTRAHWQMSITRMAEFITGVALMVADENLITRVSTRRIAELLVAAPQPAFFERECEIHER